MKSMIWQVPYILFCLAGVLAIFHVQRYRLRRTPGGTVVPISCRWWLYNVLAAALCWEAIDAWKFGTPGWPASRWLLIPSLSVVLVWIAISDWAKRKAGRL